jgi:hypothetical protein
MFTHPHLVGELARARQRDMLAQADQQRLVRQFRDLARVPRRTERVRRMTRSARRSRLALRPS